MKQFLLFLTFLSVYSFNIFGQTNTWDGSAGSSWGTAANWSLNVVPLSTHDVIIPFGNVVSSTGASIRSIQLQGNATLNISNSFTFTDASTFEPNTITNWTTGTISGGGTLSCQGIINVSTVNNKVIVNATTLNNSGTINLNDDGDIFINDGTLNNLSSGVIDFKLNDGDIRFSGSIGSHVLTNSGLIKKTFGTGTSSITADLQNMSTGTIQVEVGTIDLNNSATILNGGIYNVSTGAVLKFTNALTCNGTFTGNLAGIINWSSNLNILTSNTATFNFTGTGAVNWRIGNLTGGGTLVNNFKIDVSTIGNKVIINGTILNNNSAINFVDDGDLFINDGIVNNLTTGIIDFKLNDGDIRFSGTGSNLINNSGIIKKTVGTSTSSISAELHNMPTGIIQVEVGTIDLNNSETILNGGIYNVSTGAVLKFTNTLTCNGTFTGNLAGLINWSSNLNVVTTTIANFNFTGAGNVNWRSGSLTGGGTLINNFKIDVSTIANKFILNGTILNNNASLNLIDDGDLFINDGTINNLSTGIIDFKLNDGDIRFLGTGSHLINNTGIIKKTVGTSTSSISAELHNMPTGIIQVEVGTIDLNNSAIILNSGIYNVFAGAILKFSSLVNLQQALNGTITGQINWFGSVSVAPSTTSTFNFTGVGFINWTSGILVGGGTLVNNFKINLTTPTTKFIDNITTLNNIAIINFNDGGDLFIDNGILNNQALGIIDFLSNDGNINYTIGSSGSHIINNSGIIQKTSGTGLTRIFALTNNSGTIKASTGTLEFAGTLGFNNLSSGIVKGIATLDLPLAANFTNNGTFSPGASPGTLTVIGDFKSTATSVLEIELNGTTPGSLYDLLAIQGNAIFNGSINVTLGFEPVLNSIYTVATTTGSITQFNIPSTVVATYNGFNYTFSVANVTNNKIVLTLTQKTLGINEVVFNEDAILVYPNPSTANFNLKNTSNTSLDYVIVRDFYGRVLHKVNLNNVSNEVTISLENYASGYYFLELFSDRKSVIKKVIKQ